MSSMPMSDTAPSAVAPPEVGVPLHITPTVVCIALPLPLPDLQVVNSYVVLGGDGLTLVDPGWAYPPAEAALTEAMHQLGFAVTDVRRIVVTHQHWDHYSLGVRWRNRYGIELLLGSGERHSLHAFAQQPDSVHPAQVGMLARAGAPDLARQIAGLTWEPYELGVAFDAPDRWLHDGDVLARGDGTLVVRETPGHTRGHVVFEDAAQQLVFSGDHLLPRITPSIAFERDPEPLPLASYLDSLTLMLNLPDARMLPAHGHTAGRTWARAQELIDHHRRRLDQVSELVCAGYSTGLEVAEQMRWTRHERRLEELDIVHRMTAVLEVAAHLDLLAFRGELDVRDQDGVRYFSLP